jgi:hypothetical protein
MSGLVVFLRARRVLAVNLASNRPRKHDDEGGGIKVKVGDKEITVFCDDCAKSAKENMAK